MTNGKMTLIAVAYLLISIFNFGAINARHTWCEGKGIYSPRSQMGVSAFFALMPVAGIVIALFGTGFLENGWTLKVTCKEGAAK